jgi:hypothetical protein
MMDSTEKLRQLRKVSNYKVARLKAKLYLGQDAELLPSTRKDKKYMVYDKNNEKYIHFGSMYYLDYLKHQDPERRENYLKRASAIEGDWKDNKYSPNNLSINILW